ncbi:sensor histidine kinase [Methyloferula stellata]|uniref:sensor histidine kinase n=1 Tax=Methyloferula stellata TaxID=876270 RepID=UPI00036D972E|nr:ATP-binding protein [Methyloferula stellata]
MPEELDPWADLTAIVSGAQDAIIGQSLDGVISSWNAGAEELFGYTAGEALGRPASMLAGTSETEDRLAISTRRIKEGEAVPPYEGLCRRKDGEIVHVSLALSPVLGRSGQLLGISQIARAIVVPSAERSARPAALGRQELDLIHFSRRSDMGQMAGAVAHELNQPLTAIINYLNAARRLLGSDDAGHSAQLTIAVDRAAQQARRATDILHHLRSFTSRSDGEREHMTLRAMLAGVNDLVLISARQSGVTVVFQLIADDIVFIDRVQIQQVLLNLMRNAVEAMAETIERELRVSSDRSGAHVRVSVADTGLGISSDVAARLFEPFVTTKPDGMGIGLPICQAIIKAHGGELWFDRASSLGATFHFTLPIVARVAES